MKGWIRLGIVLSFFWVAGWSFFAFMEFMAILPGQCPQFTGGYLESVDLYFFSCNIFSDIPKNYWGVHLIHWNEQVIEFDLRRFVFIAFLPVALFWIIAILIFYSWKWVAIGFK